MKTIFQSFILFLISITLLILCLSNQILNLISTTLLPFLYITIVLLFSLAVFLFFVDSPAKTSCGCHQSHTLNYGGIFVLSFFAVITLLFYNQLSVESFTNTKGIQYIVTESPATDNSFYALYGLAVPEEIVQSQFVPTDIYELTTENYMDGLRYIQANPLTSLGKQITLEGFISRESSFDTKTITLTRIAMSCCLADSLPYGIIATADTAIPFENGQWVQVSGILTEKTYQQQLLPTIQIQKINPISPPTIPHVLIQ